MNRKIMRYTALGMTVTFLGSAIEECLEPAHLMPHAEQEDFSPLPSAQAFQLITSGNSIAANSLTPGFTMRGMNINSFVAGYRGPFDDV